MALITTQVWRFALTYSVTYLNNALVEWTDAVWISETNNPRADHDTDYFKMDSAYNAAAVVVLTDATGTTSNDDSATFNIAGGMNDGDTFQVVGTYDADGSTGIPFDILITINGTQSTISGSTQIVGAISDSPVLQANGDSTDPDNPNYETDLNIWANPGGTDLGTAVLISTVTYTPNTPTIPGNPS
jgi:hypothetical protein